MACFVLESEASAHALDASNCYRCAEFFLAMQNAMGVHPSWAELGYDSIVTCREHLER